MSSVAVLFILSLPILVFLGVRWTYAMREKEQNEVKKKHQGNIFESRDDDQDDHSDAA